jgi:hypothetical protein
MPEAAIGPTGDPSHPESLSTATDSDHLWLLAVSVVAIVLANGPYLLRYLMPADGFVYSGVAVAPGDKLSYLSAIRQGV